MGLAQIYVANPDYLVVQCWVHVTSLSPDTINETEPHVYHYTSSLRVQRTTHLWASLVLNSQL